MKTIYQILITGLVWLGVSAAASPIDTETRVSLHFDTTPISAILKMLAEQNDLNLVVSAAVEGEISIDLDNVSLDAALDAILLPNGLNYHISKDIIIVKEKSQQLVGELVARTYRLQYLDAAAAKEALAPLLSGNGKVILLAPPENQQESSGQARTSRLVVFDSPAVHAEIAAFLGEIDKKKRQISVEVKIIETNLSKDEKLGINWPKSIATSIDGVPSPGVYSYGVNDNATEAAYMPLETGNWQLGYLTVHQVDIVLEYLQQRNNAKLLSNPRLTAMENETATIEIQTVIPIQTINRFSEGAVIQDIVTFQDEEVGISLKVTPRINGDSAITLWVNPVVEEIIGYTGPPDNQKPITSARSINTVVTVRNNETVALGGLLKESQIETINKVFLLGSIPILGHLFTHRGTEAQTTDLLILITPRILE